MKITVTNDGIDKLSTEGILVMVFENVKKPADYSGEVDKLLNGEITSLIKSAEIKGKYNEITVLHTMGRISARVILVAGLGKKKELDVDKLRNVAGQACRALNKLNCRRMALTLSSEIAETIKLNNVAQAVVEGAILGLYNFNKHITKQAEYKSVTDLIICYAGKTNLKSIKQSCFKGQIIAEATNYARDLVNEPANYMTPSDMVNVAEKIAGKLALDLTVMERQQMKKEDMGALLGVAQGSAQPPKLIILTYIGNARSKKHIGFIGKGITFDSGGISIKPSENMKEMKGDMSGGAAVLAAIDAIARLKLKINVTAFVGATENLPGGKAIKPGDVVTAVNGKTIEVVNTDAEGRLTLADVLGYALKKKLSPLIDVATLTGACQVALGDIYSGLFTNNQEFADKVLKAANNAGELLWQLPMREDYRELNKSDVADIKNSGGRYGGAITAAMFLSEFVDDTPWVHLDIAGTFMADKEKGYQVKGATGVAVRTLIRLAEVMTE
jgi:leucyl aminopeptidase